MTFISWQFFIFFIIVTSVYFAIPFKYRWLFLLVAGCVFYVSFIPVYILLLFFLIIVDYFMGLLIEKSKNKKSKKIYLVLSILSTVAVLFVFKYFNFFVINFDWFIRFFDWNYSVKLLKLALPIGLSFHTFQSLAYVIEVYRGKQKAEKHFGIYALYVMFYPQLMAGPIERPNHMLHQFHEKHDFDYTNAVRGLRLMLWGAFQKVVIADRAATVVNLVYSNPSNYSSLVLVIATVLFALQIFCDFAGYSNIAIGAARIMGFKLMKNFDRPYMSKSIREFWTRWHISLSTWFRDYFYIPLGGNRVGKARHAINLLLTFLVSGLWHGAGWTFVIWGGLHGVYLLIFDLSSYFVEKFLKFKSKTISRLDSFIQNTITFILVTFAWIFFRAEDLDQAMYFVDNMFTTLGSDIRSLFALNYRVIEKLILEKEKVLGLTISNWMILILAIIVMNRIHNLQNKVSINVFLEKKPIYVRWAIYYLLIAIVLFFTTMGQEQFIYFQF